MALFKIEREDSLLKIDFGDEPGDNDAIVAEVEQTLKSVDLTGGGTLRINGRASLPRRDGHRPRSSASLQRESPATTPN